MCSSTLSLTSALDGVGVQRHAPAALPLGKTRYTLYRRLRGPQGRCERVRKILPPPGFDPRAVQPVTSRYTDWAIPARRAKVLYYVVRTGGDSLLIIWIICPIETLFYLTTGVSLHFDRFAWRQVAERLQLFHFARSPRVLVLCIAGSAVDIRFLRDIF